MQTYDIAMLAVLAAATLFGLWKGLAWQIASLSSVVVSYFVALKFSSTLAPYLSDEEPWNRFCAMLILFLGTCLAIWLVFRQVSDWIDRVRLRSFDRQIGGLVGAGKGVVLCVVLTFFCITMSAAMREKILASRSGHYIAVLIDRATPVMPREVHEVLGPYLDRLDRELAPVHEHEPAPLFDPGNEIRDAAEEALEKIDRALAPSAAGRGRETSRSGGTSR
jgi:membrane protein required for colicin V production